MPFLLEAVVSLLILVGAAFALVGSWGLVRLPSLMTRLHGPTKATTLGVGACLVASMIHFPATQGEWSAHELLITVFLFLTAPVSANLIAKAHIHAQGQSLDPNPSDDVQKGLPPTGTSKGWATLWRPDAAEPRPTDSA